jgi:hypothetical protein
MNVFLLFLYLLQAHDRPPILFELIFLFCNKNYVFRNVFSRQLHIALVVEVIKIVNELFEYS